MSDTLDSMITENISPAVDHPLTLQQRRVLQVFVDEIERRSPHIDLHSIRLTSNEIFKRCSTDQDKYPNVHQMLTYLNEIGYVLIHMVVGTREEVALYGSKAKQVYSITPEGFDAMSKAASKQTKKELREQARIARKHQPRPYSMDTFRVLESIRLTPTGLHAYFLSKALRIPSPSMHRILDRLVEDNKIRREVSPSKAVGSQRSWLYYPVFETEEEGKEESV